MSCVRDANILIAINIKDNIYLVYELLQELRESHYNQSTRAGQKIILHPHPSFRNDSTYDRICQEFHLYNWFIYDTSERLSAEILHSCSCLIGDTSSLVYTFPFCTLKPAILLMPKDSLQNDYHGIRFYNPTIHIHAENVAACLQAISTIANEDKYERAQKIKKYRENEVFHLGCSSAFIATFIVQKMWEASV